MASSASANGRTEPGKGRRPRILHLSGDFPDPVEPGKTRAIARLVELTADRFEHRVVSINRRSPRLSDLAGAGDERREIADRAFPGGTALVYRAPPRGILHSTMLERLGDRIARMAADDVPDLIVGHKLTIEGIAAARAARTLGLPYALSLQGDTDLKILSARPDLSRRFRRIFHDAAVVFPFAPWTLDAIEARLGKRQGPSVALPCALESDEVCAPRPGGTELLSVFHLASHRRKNLAGLAAAQRIRARGGAATPLAIVGGGPPDAWRACQSIVAAAPATSLEGPLGGADLRHRLNRAAGLVVPSLRESFGMVFVEALLAGAPVVYPAGQGVSGYLDGAPFAIPVDPRNPREIAAAMDRLLRDEGPIKAALARWQASPAARRFTRPAIGAAFADGLGRATREGSSKSR